MGNVIQEKQGEFTVTTDYDKFGQRIGLVSSLGAHVQYQRDGRGDIAQLVAGRWQEAIERDSYGLEVQLRWSS